MTRPPAFSWHDLGEWHLGVLPILLLLAAAYLYLRGVARAGDWPRERTVSFMAGVVVTFLATESVLGVYDMAYFSVHMIQHLLLIMVAAVLFALSAPLDLAHRAGNNVIRRVLDSRAVTLAFHPLVGFGLYFAFIPATHLTSFMNLMMEHEWVHHLEQVAFLVVGYLFFRPAFGLERGRTLYPGLRIVYVMAAVPVDTFTGLALNMTRSVPFPAYASMTPRGATSAWALSNIHLGGSIMWIGGDALMLLACIPISISWVRWENQRTRELDAILDAQGL